MHCFIGIDVHPPLAERMLKLKADWAKLGFPPADFHKHTHPHVTIIPPFETPDADTLIANLSTLTGAFPQFDADYADIAAFNRRIIHAAVNSNGLVDLGAQLFTYGRGVFHFLEEHPVFHPHTTIAYTHRPLTDSALDALTTRLDRLLGLPQHQEITSIQLYGREEVGQNYRTLVNLPLAV